MLLNASLQTSAGRKRYEHQTVPAKEGRNGHSTASQDNGLYFFHAQLACTQRVLLNLMVQALTFGILMGRTSTFSSIEATVPWCVLPSRNCNPHSRSGWISRARIPTSSARPCAWHWPWWMAPGATSGLLSVAHGCEMATGKPLQLILAEGLESLSNLPL